MHDSRLISSAAMFLALALSKSISAAPLFPPAHFAGAMSPIIVERAAQQPVARIFPPPHTQMVDSVSDPAVKVSFGGSFYRPQVVRRYTITITPVMQLAVADLTQSGSR